MLVCRLQTASAQCDQPAENCYETVCLFTKDQLEAGPWTSAGFAADPLPVGGYCSQIQNDQWFAFVAKADVVEITITPSNCQDGNGIQGAVYKDCDGPALDCNGGCTGCSQEAYTLSFVAEPGTVYYLVVDGFTGDVCDFTISTIGVSNVPTAWSWHYGIIEGKVLWDLNQDCLPDAGDLPAAGIKVNFEASSKQRTMPSNVDGSFKFLYSDPGDVVVSIDNIPGNYWGLCDSSYVVNPDSFPDTTRVNFLLTPLMSCAYMQVDLGLPPFFRACMPTGAAVKYCNTGTIAANDVFIELTVPQGLTVDSTSWPVAAQYGDTLRFEVGTVQPFQCETFYVYLKPLCDGSQLGQTKCLTAHIYPDTICPSWTGAHVELSAQCVGDSIVRFKILNAGKLPTQPNLEYIIIEEEVVLYKKTFGLPPGDSMIIEKPANGSMWRLEAEQEPGHPGRSMPAVAMEGCTGKATPTLGLINAFRQDDADDFVDIECKEIIGAYDPNLKAASPSGVGSSHLIEQNTPIEYVIHFQNTGTDTAFLVRLRDTLPINALDVNTFRPGASSHPCTWQIIDGRILEVLFDPIILPDSNVNERASHGWFEYSMDQKTDLPNGSYIENRASIYFDFNAPVITDAAWHTVGKFSVSIHEPTPGERSLWQVLGNPMRESCTFRAQEPITGISRFELSDAQGRSVRSAEFSGQQYTFERGHLVAGLYFFKIQTERDGAVAGKIVLRD